MIPARPVDLLAEAGRDLRLALQEWNAADPLKIERCHDLVKTAALNLQEFHAAIENGNPAPAHVRQMLLDVARDGARMSRIVDECTAFQRRMAQLLGISAPEYDASGVTTEMASPGVHAGVEA